LSRRVSPESDLAASDKPILPLKFRWKFLLSSYRQYGYHLIYQAQNAEKVKHKRI
jgi:hypothetical protein